MEARHCAVGFVLSRKCVFYSFQRSPGAPVCLPGVQPGVRAQADREVHRREWDGPDERAAAV